MWDVERLRSATEAAGIALWARNVDTDEITMGDRAHELWGVAGNRPVTLADLSSHIYPEDRGQVRNRFPATREVHGPSRSTSALCTAMFDANRQQSRQQTIVESTTLGSRHT